MGNYWQWKICPRTLQNHDIWHRPLQNRVFTEKHYPAKIPSHTVRTRANVRRFLRRQHTIYEPQARGSSAVIEYVTHPTAPYPGASIGRRRNPGTKKAKLAKLRARPGATRARRGEIASDPRRGADRYARISSS
jgi:hypothetical protein